MGAVAQDYDDGGSSHMRANSSGAAHTLGAGKWSAWVSRGGVERAVVIGIEVLVFAMVLLNRHIIICIYI